MILSQMGIPPRQTAFSQTPWLIEGSLDGIDAVVVLL